MDIGEDKMGILSKMFKPLMKRMFQKEVEEFEKSIERPQETQEKKLMEIIRKNRNSVFGKKYGFDDIKNVEDFRRKVPVLSYEDYLPYIERWKKHPREKILSSDSLVWWALTSGTTREKYIPVTKMEIKMTRKMSTLTFACYVRDPENMKIYDGKILTWVGPPLLRKENGIPVGYKTGAMMATANPLIKKFLFPKPEIQCILDQQLKYKKVAEMAVEADVRAMAGISSLTSTLLTKINYEFRDELKKKSKRFREAIKDDEVNFRKLWPNFQLIIIGGVKKDEYLPLFKKYLGEMDTREMFASSEANIAVQRDERDVLTPTLHLTYFQFIPYGLIEKKKKGKEVKLEAKPLYEMKKHEKGEITITVYPLYNYPHGDLFECVNTDPIELKFIGRVKDEISIFGEKVTLTQMGDALSYACRKENATISWYSCTAFDSRYRVVLSFDKNPPDKKIFAKRVDEYLREKNPIYNTIYLSLLKPIIIKIVPYKTFETIFPALKKKTHQFKPRIIDRKVYEEIEGEEVSAED